MTVATTGTAPVQGELWSARVKHFTAQDRWPQSILNATAKFPDLAFGNGSAALMTSGWPA